jgi:ABC-type multidrug transport system ATPase subunit
MDLRIRQLAKTHPDATPALVDVTLTAAPGVCGLLGAAGAGKSTLLAILAGVQAADRGRVHLGDIDLLDGSAAARRCVGHLPQGYAPTCKGSAADLLDHLAVLKGLPGYQARRDIVDALLDQVGLSDARREPAALLSEGGRRRFGLAAALLGRPPLLLLDAPLAGLEDDERARLLALLADLGRHHVVLLATREAADVATASTQVALLERGMLRRAA